MPADTLADLLEACVAVLTAERRLEQLGPTSLDRPATEAALKRARERYARAVKAHETAVAAQQGR